MKVYRPFLFGFIPIAGSRLDFPVYRPKPTVRLWARIFLWFREIEIARPPSPKYFDVQVN